MLFVYGMHEPEVGNFVSTLLYPGINMSQQYWRPTNTTNVKIAI